MLQITERGFNAPTHGIQPFDFWKGILFGIQISNNGFAGGIRNWKTNDSERQSIERSRIMLSGGLRQIIKSLSRCNQFIVVFVFQQLLNGIGLFSGKLDAEWDIMFFFIRQYQS